MCLWWVRVMNARAREGKKGRDGACDDAYEAFRGSGVGHWAEQIGKYVEVVESTDGLFIKSQDILCDVC
jgi:hypothetical protein